MSRSETLRRVAAVLKSTVAPAVGDEYATTQAHMAAVVIDKIARELELEPSQSAARENDQQLLMGALEAIELPATSATAQARAAALAAPADATLAALVAAIHAEREHIGAATSDELLAAIRHYLRADLERRLASAR